MNYKSVYRRTISDRNWTLPFGKYKGETIANLMESNPQYLEWCISADLFELDYALLDELETLNPWMAKT